MSMSKHKLAGSLSKKTLNIEENSNFLMITTRKGKVVDNWLINSVLGRLQLRRLSKMKHLFAKNMKVSKET